MAGVPGYFQPLTDSYLGEGGSPPGIIVGENEALGRPTTGNPTSLSPQFSDQMVVGRPINLQPMQLPYDRPEQRPTRPPRQPRWFLFAPERWNSNAEWPFLPNMQDPLRHGWVGMTGARLPMFGPGWGNPRKNIVSNPSMPYGNLTSLYPHLYATMDTVV